MSKILPNVLELWLDDGLIRLSVGIEDINDIISDLESALKSPG